MRADASTFASEIRAISRELPAPTGEERPSTVPTTKPERPKTEAAGRCRSRGGRACSGNAGRARCRNKTRGIREHCLARDFAVRPECARVRQWQKTRAHLKSDGV